MCNVRKKSMSSFYIEFNYLPDSIINLTTLKCKRSAVSASIVSDFSGYL